MPIIPRGSGLNDTRPLYGTMLKHVEDSGHDIAGKALEDQSPQTLKFQWFRILEFVRVSFLVNRS